jgi:hypothetical protein
VLIFDIGVAAGGSLVHVGVSTFVKSNSCYIIIGVFISLLGLAAGSSIANIQ